jgi:hypothetical protein
MRMFLLGTVRGPLRRQGPTYARGFGGQGAPFCGVLWLGSLLRMLHFAGDR